MNSSARSYHKPPLKVIQGQGKRGKNNKPTLWLLIIIAAFAGYLIQSSRTYEEAVTLDPDGNPILIPDREAEIARRQQKNSEEAEQYILIAITPGYRECYLCPEGKVWLETGEIAKIGFSTNGQKRYSLDYYERHDVFYRMEYRGDLTTSKNKEIARLGSYPLLPENQKRRQKLLYPPLNSKLD